MNSHQRLIQLEKSLETSGQFEVLRNENNWLKDYIGHTYSEKLQYLLTRGLFEEHAKKADIGYANIEKAMVFSIDPKTREILSLGGSSLLREKKSDKLFESVLQSIALKKRKTIPDLIMDNFGLWYSAFFVAPPTATTINVIDDANSSQQLDINAAAGAAGFLTGASGGHLLKMGSGSTSPARSDYKIQTNLGASPESGYVNSNLGAYTVSNTVIYQGDANPTGGSGTVNEIGSFAKWGNHSAVLKVIMLAHDAVSPGVAYSAGKLLRGAYTWQL